jgi:hypothetical protein
MGSVYLPSPSSDLSWKSSTTVEAMDDEAAFDILNDYEPGFALQPRKEVLWDLVIVYPDDLVDEILDIDGRVLGTFDVSASQARFRMGGSMISLDFVDSVEHMRRGVIVKGQTSLRQENKDAPLGISESGPLQVTWYLVPRRLKEI